MSLAERMGFEPMCPLGQTVFKTASLWPLRYLSVSLFLFCTFLARTNDMLTKRSVSVNAFSGFFLWFLHSYLRIFYVVFASVISSFFTFLCLPVLRISLLHRSEWSQNEQGNGQSCRPLSLMPRILLEAENKKPQNAIRRSASAQSAKKYYDGRQSSPIPKTNSLFVTLL